MNYNNHVKIDSNIPIIKYDEAEKLISLAQKGSLESRNKIVEGNLRLVLNIVQRFKTRKESFEDLFQVGIIGLIKAIDNFDLTRGVRFSTYAVPMILGEIKRYIRDNQTMRISRSIKENSYKIKMFIEEFQLKNAREPKISEVVLGTEIDEEDIIIALGSMNEIISLNKTFGEDSDDKIQTLEEKIADEKNWLETWLEKENLIESFKALNKREKIIIKLRYYLDKTQTEVSEELGISQAHVSRIEKIALTKLKKVI